MEDVGPDGECLDKDAIFLSPHKFVGGPGTPGILVVKRKLLTNRVPTVPGGGTVAYVNAAEHRYLTRSGAPRRGGDPRDHRIDTGRTGVPAQGRGRRWPNQVAGTRFCGASRLLLERKSEYSNPRQSQGLAPLNRLVHDSLL